MGLRWREVRLGDWERVWRVRLRWSVQGAEGRRVLDGEKYWLDGSSL